MSDERKEKERRLNLAALSWKTISPEGNEDRIKSLYEQVFILSFELFDKPYKQKNGQIIENDPMVFMKVFEEARERYEPDKGPFSNYLSMLISKRSIDQKRHDNLHAPAGDSLYAPVSASEDNDLTLADVISSEESGTESGVMFENLYVELTALVLNFSENHTGRQANETRRKWYRIFFTEDMTETYKTHHFNFSKEREIFRAILLPYLDYYMSRRCRTGKDVAMTALKPYCEVVSARKDKMEETEVPLPADVSLAYLELCEGVSATPSARSNQLKFYREEVGRIETC